MDINKDLIKTKGFVLSEVRYRESSKIIDLFTKNRGRINVFVYGALRPNNNLMLVTEKFVESDFVLVKNKNSFNIKSADIINSNIELGKRPKNYIIAELVSELLLKTMPDNLVDEVVYDLSTSTLNALKLGDVDGNLIKIGFMLKYISIIGFRPHLSNCVSCRTTNLNGLYFSPEVGGLICGNCLEIVEDYDKLNKIELETIIKFLLGKYEDYKEFDIDIDTQRKLEKIIYKYVIYNTELTDLESRKKFIKLFEI